MRRLVTALLAFRISPRREVIPPRAARGFRIWRDDAHARFHQVVPVFDVLGIPFAHEKHDRARVRCRVVRQPFLPVLRDQFRDVVECVDVRGQRERHHVGAQAVDDRARLLAGAAMRLLDRHVVAGFRLPVFGEGRVVVRVEFARRVVRDVEQLNVLRGERRGAEHRDERKDTKKFHGCDALRLK